MCLWLEFFAIWRGPRPESRLLVATSRPEERFGEIGAGNETRTRDPNVGKVVLYQLSYSRMRVEDSIGLCPPVKLNIVIVLRVTAKRHGCRPAWTKT